MASGLLAVVTAIWPDWIERAFGIDQHGVEPALLANP